MVLSSTVRASLRKGGKFYVARCLNLPVVAQGATVDEAMANLEEAVALHLEGQDLEMLGIAQDHTIQVNMELPAAHA